MSLLDPLDLSVRLLQALQNPSLYNHPVHEFQVIETHISWVVLTGTFAYKIKKPVDLGFVDFSTLARRRHFCAEELRLNRRLAPDMYISVVTITGTPEKPEFSGRNPAIEYAVKMKQFSQESLLTNVLNQGHLHATHIDALAIQVAEFHARIQVAGPDTPFGLPDTLAKPVLANFQYLPVEASDLLGEDRIDALRNWTERKQADHQEIFLERKSKGFIRECHGDLHLGNMALIDSRVVIFDCIEFNDMLRWVDVMSELAFTVMDLIDRGRSDFAYRLLNSYLEYTGDYQGLVVLRYYLTYRAMVRAKVAGIRLDQEKEEGGPQRNSAQKDLKGYLELAERLTQPSQPSLIIMHGLSGSGKSTVSQLFLEMMGAIRLRSDVERKRLFGLSAEALSRDTSVFSIYGREATESTYHKLEEQAEKILDAGYTVIVDATFLKKAQRQTFQYLASQKHVPYLILDVFASKSIMRDRVSQREKNQSDVSDATVTVLEDQIRHQEFFALEEKPFVIRIQNDETFNPDGLKEELGNRGFTF